MDVNLVQIFLSTMLCGDHPSQHLFLQETQNFKEKSECYTAIIVFCSFIPLSFQDLKVLSVTVSIS